MSLADEMRKDIGGETDAPDTSQSLADSMRQDIASKETKLETRPTLEDKNGFWTHLGRSAVQLADTTIGGVIPAVTGAITYAGQRAAGRSPEQAAENANAVSDITSHPFQKALGTESDTGTTAALDFVAKNASKGVDWIAQQTGLPKSDVGNMLQSASLALPAVLGKIGNYAADVNSGKFAKTYEKPVSPAPTETMPNREMVGGGAAQVSNNPLPKLTGEEAGKGTFPTIKLSKTDNTVPSAEQDFNSLAIQHVLGEGVPVRNGAISRDANILRNEYAQANAANPTPAGLVLKQQMADEQNGLSNNALKLVENTGALPSYANDYQRGEFLNDAMVGRSEDNVGVQGYIKNIENQIYNKARDVNGDKPIESQYATTFFNDPQVVSGAKLNGTSGVLNGAQEMLNLAKTVGFKDEFGNIHAPNTVGAFDAVKKAINQGWTPENSKTIRSINNSITSDIASSGGAELLKMADSLHSAQKNMFESKGIKNLFGEVDPNGVQKGTAFADIAPKLTNMPFDQWRHIYDTYDQVSKGRIPGAPEGLPPVPKELINQAEQAKFEMKGMLVRGAVEAGTKNAGEWSAHAFKQYLNQKDMDMKLAHSMTPDEIKELHYQNVVGQLLPAPKGYEGAGQQMRRMDELGLLEKHAGTAGAIIGAKTGIPFVSNLLEKAGNTIGRNSTLKRQTNEALSLQEQMKKNSLRGK